MIIGKSKFINKEITYLERKVNGTKFKKTFKTKKFECLFLLPKNEPQKERIPKNDLPNRIVKGNLNPEFKRKLASQEIIPKGKSQSSSKKNSFQQVKQRSALPKRDNQKVQKRMNPRPKPRSGEKK